MRHRKSVLITAVGAVLTVAGAIVSVVFLLQPWRSCPYDDSPAGCVMLPADALVLGIAVIGTLVGIALLGLGLGLVLVQVLTRRPKSSEAEGRTA